MLPDYDHDGRYSQLKLKDAPSDAPVAIAAPGVVLPMADSVPVARGISDSSRQPGARPRLNLLYCIYLI